MHDTAAVMQKAVEDGAVGDQGAANMSHSKQLAYMQEMKWMSEHLLFVRADGMREGSSRPVDSNPLCGRSRHKTSRAMALLVWIISAGSVKVKRVTVADGLASWANPSTHHDENLNVSPRPKFSNLLLLDYGHLLTICASRGDLLIVLRDEEVLLDPFPNTRVSPIVGVADSELRISGNEEFLRGGV